MPLMPVNLIEGPIVLQRVAQTIRQLSRRLRRLAMSKKQQKALEAMELARSQDRVVEKYLQAQRRLN